MLVGLRRRFNALVPIDRLPPEILSIIFHEVVLSADSDGTTRLYNRADACVQMGPVLTLSYVSSRWRTLALKTPSLWTRADNRNEAQLDAFLERSQVMPLSLHLLTEDPKQMDRLLAVQGYRIRRLDLTEYPDWICPPTCLSFRAPLLDCLTVSSECDLIHDLDNAESTSPFLFGERITNLKAFALQPVCMWLPGNCFPYLTHLYLSNFKGRMLHGNTIHHLTLLLSNTPLLKYFHLTQLPKLVSTLASTSSANVVLSSLRAITCDDSDLGAALSLLEHLELPEDALVRLDSLYCGSDRADEAQQPRRLPSTRLLESFTSMSLVADDSELHVIAEGPQSGLWIRASCAGPEDGDQGWVAWISMLHVMLSLTSIHTLYISVIAPSILPHILHHMPSLTQLTVYINPDAMQIDEVLCCRLLLSNLYSALAEEPLHCSALESLTIESREGDLGSFRLPNPLPEDFDEWPGSPDAGVLLRMVDVRSRLDKPLHRFVLHPHWHLDDRLDLLEEFKEPLAMLKKHVASVVLVEDGEVLLSAPIFNMRAMWQVDGFEDYWELADGDRPMYRIPMA